MARKSEVYSWRVSPALKTSLEEAARRERVSVSRLLDQIVEGYLEASRERVGSDAEEQLRLHQRAARFAGCIAGQTNRAANVRQLVQARLRRLRRAV